MPTYDEKPEMSAAAATDAFVEGWQGGEFGFGIINFANPDMVGHTGVIEAAVKAIETRGRVPGPGGGGGARGRGICVITADHGNADHMLEPDGSPNTAHSMNPVPLIVTADVGELREGGILADVAPTILALMGQEQPEQMSGEKLSSLRRVAFARVRPCHRSTPATAPRAPGVIHTAHGDVRTPAFVPLASTATVKSLHAAEVAALGFDMVLGNTFHLFVQPGRSGRARWAACTSSWAGGGRSSPTPAATRSSRWATARWRRRSSGAATAAAR